MFKSVKKSVFVHKAGEKFKKREQFCHKWYIFVTNYGGVCSHET